jgi:multicomponent Na+:H+ antiporter subunit E
MSAEKSRVEQQTGAGRGYRGLIIQAILLMGLWLIMSGRFYPEPIIYGAISVALVIWLNRRVSHIPMADGSALTGQGIKVLRWFGYMTWLVWQIIKSGVYVAYVVLNPKLLNPRIVRFKTNMPAPLAKVILGNSISLTPGTLTLDIYKDYFTIHALVAEMADDVISGEMEARVAELYLESCNREDMCDDVCVMERLQEMQEALDHEKEKS